MIDGRSEFDLVSAADTVGRGLLAPVRRGSWWDAGDFDGRPGDGANAVVEGGECVPEKRFEGCSSMGRRSFIDCLRAWYRRMIGDGF